MQGGSEKTDPPANARAGRIDIKRPTAPRPQAVDDASSAALLALLRMEAEARKIDDPKQLIHLIANETRKLIRARQVFLLKRSRGRVLRIQAISSVDVVDRNTPLVRWIERIVGRLASDTGLQDIKEFALPAYCDDDDEEVATYPFRNFLWAPLKLRDDTVFAGLLVSREQVWLEADTVVVRRLTDCFAHAWSALSGAKSLRRTGLGARYLWLLAAVLVAGAMALPIPMTALAPAEIVPKHPYIVTAPIDGTVREVVVRPNAPVKVGDQLVQIEDIELRNELQLAENQVLVAQSQLKRSSQAAFDDPEARRELRIAMSELELRRTERDYARDRLSKVSITATTTGLAVFGSVQEWAGRPVRTGERIMQIADPDKVEVRVRLPVSDALVLKQGAKMKLYLDSDPLHPVTAVLTQAGHEASEDETGTLSYRLTGELDDQAALPRIGTRGTAQVYGEDTALFFYLFRKPIMAVRQHLGL